MNCLLSILLTAILCASASAQTIKTLGFNSTNGQVVANTGTNFLTFTNHVAFSASDITTYGSGISSFGVSLNFEERRLQDVAITNDIFNWASGEYVELGLPLAFVSTTNSATTRANLGFSTNLNTLWTATNGSNARSAVGLELAALTNTSNVTTMRALAGSTNTNQPFSGTFYVTDPEAVGTWQLTFSNGILLSVIEI